MSSMITGQQIDVLRLKTLKMALETHVRFKGQFRMTRVDYLGLARQLGYKGRTAKALLADLVAKNPDL
jgi:hypothetical protein